MADRPCPECHGARLKPTSLAVTVGERNIHEFTLMSVREALGFLRRPSSSPTRSASSAAASSRRSASGSRSSTTSASATSRCSAPRPRSRGGEAQRIRLATQIGSALIGRALHPRRAQHRPAPARQPAPHRHAAAPARPRQHRASSSSTTRRRCARPTTSSTWARAPASTAARSSPRARPQEVMADPASLTGDFLAGRRSIALPGQRRLPVRVVHRARRAHAQPARHRRRVPARRLHLRHRRLRLRQVHARQRDPLQGHGGAPQPRHQAARRRARRHRRRQAAGQGHRHRPVAHRPHAALQPGHLHRRLRPHPRALRADAGEQAARLQAGPLQLQRQGRALRDLQGRRADQDRDALPAGRVRALRGLQGQALQPRDAGGPLQGQEHRRRARDDRRGGGRLLRQRAAHRPAPQDARRRRPGLHQARPAGDHALRRRGAARQARQRAQQGRHRQDALHPRRAHHRPALRRHREAARGAPAPRRPGQHGGRHRAQPRRHQDRRLDHRPRPGGRGRRRRHRRRRHARGPRRPARHLVHRRLPGARVRREAPPSRPEAARPAPRGAGGTISHDDEVLSHFPRSRGRTPRHPASHPQQPGRVPLPRGSGRGAVRRQGQGAAQARLLVLPPQRHAARAHPGDARAGARHRVGRHSLRGRGAPPRGQLHQGVAAAVQPPAARRQELPLHRDHDARRVAARALLPRAARARQPVLRAVLERPQGP